jgi:hypothetical protein
MSEFTTIFDSEAKWISDVYEKICSVTDEELRNRFGVGESYSSDEWYDFDNDMEKVMLQFYDETGSRGQWVDQWTRKGMFLKEMTSSVDFLNNFYKKHEGYIKNLQGRYATRNRNQDTFMQKVNDLKRLYNERKQRLEKQKEEECIRKQEREKRERLEEEEKKRREYLIKNNMMSYLRQLQRLSE